MKKLLCNWKSYLSIEEGRALLSEVKGVSVPFVVFPSLALLSESVAVLGSERVGVQHAKSSHAGMTGEDTIAHVHAIGARSIIVGHSEQRGAGESLEEIAAQFQEACKLAMLPVLCIGETKEERDAGIWKDVLKTQLTSALANLDEASAMYYVAYEPVWAIGTGVPASKNDIEEAIAVISDILQDVNVAPSSVLYGGSVSKATIEDILAYAGVDGVLVGKASTQKDELLGMLDKLA